ncbi:MAG: glycosyltransferase [Promethearchaeota archaeon]
MIENKDKIWIFTFEYAGIAKMGGLGEVPANQAKHLKKYFDITVFIPSHGQVDRLKMSSTWEKLPIKCTGQINSLILGINEIEEIYSISFYRFTINDVNVFLITGENSFTKRFLDDKDIYNPDTINGKICLFSIGIRCLVDFLIENRKENLPDVIHLHDYHVVFPFLGLKQILIKNGLDVPSIITIHLLTWPRYPIAFYRACGIDQTPIKILLNEGFKTFTIDEIFSLCADSYLQAPSVEKIGAVVSDLVTTVSQSYLNSDIIPYCGKDLIEFKSDFIWDGCDWEYFEIYRSVIQSCGAEIRELLNISLQNEISKKNLKEYLLKYKIGHLNQSPFINSTKVLDVINEISNGKPFIKNGTIQPFYESGPLVITTGRISPQKGFETIFEAIPKIIKVIPKVKFLFLILPSEYSLNEIRDYAKFVKNYPNNIRIIFGVASEIYFLTHIAADVYCALSRWEPFGINALEAMASKIPIIATQVGGFQETIIDMREYPEIGTGILIKKDNISQFTDALISLLKLAEISEKTKDKGSIYETETLKIVNQIPDEIIKSRVLLDPNYYNKIKENCYKRVKGNFKWSIVSKKLIELYDRIKSKHITTN